MIDQTSCFSLPSAKRARSLLAVSLTAALFALSGCGDPGGPAALPSTTIASTTTDATSTDPDAFPVVGAPEEVTDELAEGEPVVDAMAEEQTETLTEKLADTDYLQDAPEHEQLAMVEASCSGVTDLYLDTYQSVLDLLGDAGRDNSERIDFALESFGAGGQFLEARYSELGCDGAELNAAVCTGVSALKPQGQVGEDMVARLSEGC